MEIGELAKVIKVQNYNMEVVINKGSKNEIYYTSKFLVFRFGEEMFDPDTNESLGKLEIVCGKAKVKHIQDRMTTLITNEVVRKTNKTIVKKSNFMLPGNNIEERQEPEEEFVPFEDVDTSCFARLEK